VVGLLRSVRPVGIARKLRLGEADASGRRRPVPAEGTEFFVPADTVLSAVGESADVQSWPETLRGNGSIVPVDGFGATTAAAVFAGGDVVDQPHTVAHALGSGKRAALGIDRYLRHKAGETVDERELQELRLGRIGNVSITRWRRDDPVARVEPVNEVIPFEQINMDHFLNEPRQADRELAVERSRRGFDEVNQGLERQAAMAEARRCFNCGVCNGCDICLIFCPDIAIRRNSHGPRFEITYDYCKGCGVCAAECPRGAMAMTGEGLER